jgi:hypothetical protein
MAISLNKAGIKIATVDLTEYVTSLTINRGFDELEVSALGDLGRKFVKGLETSTITISLINDTATAKVLPTLQAAYGTTVTVVVIQDKGAVVSGTNPLYTMSCLINNLQDVNGGSGDLATMDLTFTVNGTIAVATTGTF